jgi:hypothetical protein
VGTASVHFHNKFSNSHDFHYFLFYPEEHLFEREQAAVHFLEVEYTAAVKSLPHSKQLAFSRDVINPQDGHILCVPYSAIRGLSLRIQWSSRGASRTISRPKEILVALINATLLGESCHTGWADHNSLKSQRVGELQMDWLRSEDLKEEKNVTAPILIIAVDALCHCQVGARRTIARHASSGC